jgi:hypothetical protein
MNSQFLLTWRESIGIVLWSARIDCLIRCARTRASKTCCGV